MKNLSNILFQSNLTDQEIKFYYPTSNSGSKIFNRLNGLSSIYIKGNYIQDASNSQNYNRYAYCYNNPLKYTDPDGNWAIADDFAAGLIGMGINLVSQGLAGNITSWQSFIGYAAVGASSGVASLYGSPIAGGVIQGAGNEMVLQMETNGWDFDGIQKTATNWRSVTGAGITSGIVAGVTAGIGNPVGAKLKPSHVCWA
jgi:hypothetical protein